MSTSAHSTTSNNKAHPFSVRMKRCLLDCLACYAAAN
ncbi:hypothetical protein CTP10_R27710 [Cupriavidus sp. P-10]|nr:hypothetical protein CTP10_R27710 [Cupriavidus sp. P-10]